jgi:hypothetical protein
MAQRSVDERTREWTKLPDRALPYGPFARLADWWSAGRDARVVLPNLLVPIRSDEEAPINGQLSPAEPGAGPDRTLWGTPHTVFLGQIGRGRAEKEWLRYKAEIADQLIQLRHAHAKREAATHRLETARAEISKMQEPGQDQLKVRVSGEERTDPTIVANRRLGEYRAQLRSKEAAVTQARAEVASCEAEIALAGEPVKIRFEVAQTRAEMIDAYVRRRCASYLRRLTRKHSDAPKIGPLVRADWPERPSWTTWKLSPDLAGFRSPDQDQRPPSAGG